MSDFEHLIVPADHGEDLVSSNGGLLAPDWIVTPRHEVMSLLDGINQAWGPSTSYFLRRLFVLE